MTKEINLLNVEQEIASVAATIRNGASHQLIETPPIDYAPPALRNRQIPMPEYVEHREGISQVGRLSSEAVVREYEAAAQEMEAMGAELKEAAARCEQMTANVHGTIAYVRETAQLYREEAKKIFSEIQNVSLLNNEVRQACEAVRLKISEDTA